MNYLAHLFVCPPDPESMVGNLMADFRKFVDIEAMPKSVKDGIANHQRVDKFTDTHPLVTELRQEFQAPHRRFSGIIIDVVFDYFLSKHWHKYTNIDRALFISNAYVTLNEMEELLPERMHRALVKMSEQDWLGSYSTLDGIEVTLERIGTRIRFANPLAGSRAEIERLHDPIEQCFLQFFPDLIGNFEHPV
jgi:acyl carrier protein phosphodiesterase